MMVIMWLQFQRIIDCVKDKINYSAMVWSFMEQKQFYNKKKKRLEYTFCVSYIFLLKRSLDSIHVSFYFRHVGVQIWNKLVPLYSKHTWFRIAYQIFNENTCPMVWCDISVSSMHSSKVILQQIPAEITRTFWHIM